MNTQLPPALVYTGINAQLNKLNETSCSPLAGFPLQTHAFFKFSDLEELRQKQRPSVWLKSSFQLPFAYLSLSKSCHSRFRRLVWLQSFDGWVLIFLNKWSDCIAYKSEGEIFAPLQLRNRWYHIKRPPPTTQTHLVDSPIFRVFVFFCFLSEVAAMGWWRLISAALAGILYFHSFCFSDQAPNYSFMQQATKAQAVSYYDYIIIGGGTAGCPLAATLSLNSKVLLLERGDSPYGNQNISNLINFSNTLSDLSPTSPSQRFISEDGVINARARVLGGGSCLNAGFYTRASPSYVRASGWDGRLVNSSYEWVERLVAFEPRVLQWQSAVRDGLVEVGVLPYNGFTYDHMYGTKVGGSIFDKDGHRHTAADLLKYANPSGLTVLLHATVHRILFRTAGKAKPLAHGVIFTDGKGVVHRAYLNKGSKNEIIVSAGSIGSPQLLMLSGIGPARQLQKLGIKVTVDQPLVGQGMSDNPMNAIYIPSPLPVEVSLIQVVGITRFGSYIEAAGGSNFAPRTEIGPQRNFGMFSPQTGQISTVPPKQRTPEAIEKAVKAMNSLEDESFRGGFILEKIMGPISTGHLELKNRNPNDNPSVTFNYFKEPQDLQRCVEGIKTIERVVQSKAFSKFRYPFISLQALINMTSHFPVNMRPRHENDSTSLEQFCKDTVMTIWHYHGGCQVGRVVDHDYRVLGVDALRVIDGSTFNYSPGTNPQATVMMLGRYMGVKIRNQRLGMNGLD